MREQPTIQGSKRRDAGGYDNNVDLVSIIGERASETLSMSKYMGAERGRHTCSR